MIEVRKSEIHRYGVFAVEEIPYGAMVPNPSFVKCKRWRKFKGFNRSCFPNSIIDVDDEVHAVRSIQPGEEITLGYILNECNCSNCKE